MTEESNIPLLLLVAAYLGLSGCADEPGPWVPYGPESPLYTLVEPGTFWEGNRDSNDPQEGPGRQVTLTYPFWIKTVEVTRAEYRDVVGIDPSPSDGCGDSCPVSGTTWFDAVFYCNTLSEREGLEPCYDLSNCALEDGDEPGGFDRIDLCFGPTTVDRACTGYRMPSNAEWEYAAESGTGRTATCGGAYCWGDLKRSVVPTQSVYPVGQHRPNAWGLYDMNGNVAELTTEGCYLIDTDPVTDPWDTKNDFRTYGATCPRGGSAGFGYWDSQSRHQWNAEWRHRTIGFRPVRRMPE